MNAHYSNVVGHIRIYSEGSYKERSPYDCILTITWMSDIEVLITGVLGKLNTKEVKNVLLGLGVKRVRYERNGELVKTSSEKQVRRKHDN